MEFELSQDQKELRDQIVAFARQHLNDDLERRNLTLAGYLASLDERGERQRFDQDLEASAGNGVRRDMVLERLLEERGTELSDEEFSGAVRQLAAREGKDPQRFRRERGQRWLANYRFLLARDRALRETVRELVAPAEATAAGPEASAADDA